MAKPQPTFEICDRCGSMIWKQGDRTWCECQGTLFDSSESVDTEQ